MNRVAFIDGLAISSYTATVLLFSYQAEGTQFSKLAAFALLAVAAVHILRGARGVAVPREFLLFAIWLMIAALSGFFAIDQATAAAKAFSLLQIMTVSFALYLLLVWNRSVKPLMWAYVAGLSVVAVSAVRHPELYSSAGRLAGALGNANIFGLALLVGITFLTYLASASKSRLIRLMCYPMGGFFFFALLETGSRKAMIGVLIVLLLTALVSGGSAGRTYSRRRTISLVTGLCLVVAAGYYIMQSEHYDRIDRVVAAVESGDSEELGKSEQGRLLGYQRGLSLLIEHPAIGIGLDNYRHARFGLSGNTGGGYSHSNYVELAVGTGILGFLVYYAAYASMAWRLFKLRHSQMDAGSAALWRALAALFMIMVTYDFAGVTYYQKIPWLVLVAILAGLRNLDQLVAEGREVTDRRESGTSINAFGPGR